MARRFYVSFVSAFLAVAVACSAFAARVGDFVAEVVHLAFPPTPRPDYAFAVAAAPRVTGLDQVRSFRQRLAERYAAGHGRAPLSTAFVAT